jgi:hypothetical protein
VNSRPILSIGLISLYCICILASAQEISGPKGDAPTEAASTPTLPKENQSAGAQSTLIVREGTVVKLKFGQSLSSKLTVDGDPVNLILDEDLRLGEVTIAKAGAEALATVSHAKKARMLGRGGELSIRLEYVIVRNSRVRLRGTKGKEGQGKEGTVVALTILFGPIGLIKHGKNVEVTEGTPFVAYVDQDFVVPECL